MKTKTKRRPAAAIYDELTTLATSIRNTYALPGTAARIEACVAKLKRRPARRRAPISSVPMTPAIASQIRKVARLHPTWSQHRIAALVGVNPGRVSEVLSGRRVAR